jgi:hypothetical protein
VATCVEEAGEFVDKFMAGSHSKEEVVAENDKLRAVIGSVPFGFMPGNGRWTRYR